MLDGEERHVSTANVAKRPEPVEMRHHRRQYRPGGNVVEQIVQRLLLGGLPGQQEGGTGIIQPVHRRNLEANRLSHPAENGDVPHRSIGNANGRVRPGNDALNAAQIHQQIVLRGCRTGGGLQNGALQAGFFQLLPGHFVGAQGLGEHPLRVICRVHGIHGIHNDSSLMNFFDIEK